MDKKKQELQRALDGITTFPDEMKDRPQLHEWGSKHTAIVRIGIRAEGISVWELQQRSQELKDKILAAPSISKVEEWGKKEREVHIELDLEKMSDYQVTFDEVTTAIQSHNIKQKNGTLRSYTSEKDIVTLSRFNNILDVSDVIIRSDFEGNRVTLTDIATVQDTFEEEYSVLRFNGNRGIILSVHKKAGHDIIKSVEKDLELMKGMNVVQRSDDETKWEIRIIPDYEKVALMT